MRALLLSAILALASFTPTAIALLDGCTPPGLTVCACEREEASECEASSQPDRQASCS